MSDDDDTGRPDDGFEWQGRFYRWHVTDMGKDLMLIDRLSGLPVYEFFELVDDDHERQRVPILLSLIATSLRHGHPDWSVERILRAVHALKLSEVTFLGADREEEATPDPPAPDETGSPPPPRSEPSKSTRNGSSSSSTPKATSPSKTSSANQS